MGDLWSTVDPPSPEVTVGSSGTAPGKHWAIQRHQHTILLVTKSHTKEVGLDSSVLVTS